MARQVLNIVMDSTRGHIGRQVVFREYKGRTIVCKYPDMSNVVPSEKQRRQTTLMTEASVFATRVNNGEELITDPDFKIKPGQSVFHAAVSWYMTRRRAGNPSRLA